MNIGIFRNLEGSYSTFYTEVLRERWMNRRLFCGDGLALVKGGPAAGLDYTGI
jgi:hypothetical protein